MPDIKNTLYYGDNLAVLKQLVQSYPQGCIDLIYIDPPFNSQRNYNILYKDLIRKANGDKVTAQKEAFRDTWSNIEISDQLNELKRLENLSIHRFLESNRALFSTAQASYLTMMAIRLHYMRKILKDTGTFYLHCDPTMSHYLKLLCDMVFGRENFRNEIVWQRTNNPKGSQFKEKKYGVFTDSIFFYTKSNTYSFYINEAKRTLGPAELDKKYPYQDNKGRYYQGPIVRSKSMGERPNLCYEYKGYHPGGYGWRMTQEKLIALDKAGHLGWTKNGRPFRKLRPADDKGNPLSSLWCDIPRIQSQSKEYLGYPTQKPEALLERIIKASSKKGALVADFFCGCGTTITVAEKLNRRWIGVDISHLAIDLIENKRLKPLQAEYKVHGFPKDLASAEQLAKSPFAFQHWIIEKLLGGHSYGGGGDDGLDGHMALRWKKKNLICLIQVKAGAIQKGHIRDFSAALSKHKGDMGIFVGFQREITKGMQKEADEEGLLEGQEAMQPLPRLSILSVEQLLQRAWPVWLFTAQNTTYG